MTEQWVAEAIAAQEEYLKQVRSCMDVPGQPHSPRRAGDPKTGEVFMVCVVCGVKNPKNYGTGGH